MFCYVCIRRCRGGEVSPLLPVEVKHSDRERTECDCPSIPTSKKVLMFRQEARRNLEVTQLRAESTDRCQGTEMHMTFEAISCQDFIGAISLFPVFVSCW